MWNHGSGGRRDDTPAVIPDVVFLEPFPGAIELFVGILEVNWFGVFIIETLNCDPRAEPICSSYCKTLKQLRLWLIQ